MQMLSINSQVAINSAGSKEAGEYTRLITGWDLIALRSVLVTRTLWEVSWGWISGCSIPGCHILQNISLGPIYEGIFLGAEHYR